MTTQYTTILKLALPVQGELSGTWGDVVNDNITQMVEQAVAGKAVINTWTANSHTLTTADGTTSESRCAILELTDSGTALTGAGTVVCPTNTKLYIVDNNTAEIITVQTAAGTGVAVPVGKTMLVYCDGTNVVEGVTHANSLSLGTSTVTADKILDEDNMASDSATAIATQQSIKAYVDSQVGTVDTLSEILANGNTTGANDIDVDSAQKVQFRDADIYLNSSVDGQLDIVADTEIQIAATTVDLNGNLDVSGTALVAGVLTTTAATVFNGGFASNADSTLGTDKKVQFRDSAIYINSSVDGQLDLVADTEIQIAATTVDLNGNLDVSGTLGVTGVATLASLVATTADINAGTIDNTVIGGSTAAAGTFTTFTSTGIDDNATSTAITIDSNETVDITTGVLSTNGAFYYGSPTIAQVSANRNSTTGAIPNASNSSAYLNLNTPAGSSSMEFVLGDAVNTQPSLKMIITGAGNVGIGTDSPAIGGGRTYNVALTIDGGVSGGAEDTGALEVGGSTSVNDRLVGSISYFNRDNSGADATTRRQVAIIEAKSVTSDSNAGDDSGANLTFSTKSEGGSVAERMRIDASGNVGIGTSSPSGKLDVSVASNQRIRFDDFGSKSRISSRNDAAAILPLLIDASDLILNSGSGGNVGIGGTPTDKLTLLDSGNLALRVKSTGAANEAQVWTHNDAGAINGMFMYGSTHSTYGAIAAGEGAFYSNTNVNIMSDSPSGVIKFSTGASGGAERMRIDASGNLLVGKTTTALATAGLTLGGAGFASLTRSGAEALNVNRLSSDGDLAVFYKDSAVVGSIGTDTSRFKVKSNSLALYLENEGNKQLVWGNVSGVPYFYPQSDNDTNIGFPTQRFKDLTLSGTSNVGVGRFTAQSLVHSAATLVLGHEGSSKSQIRAYGINAGTVGSLEFNVSAADGTGSKSMTLDASGNLLVGVTSAGADGGVTLSTTGYIQARIDNDTVAYLDRTGAGDDGEIIRLQQNGATVGSILSSGGDGIIIQGVAAGSGLLLHNSNAILPAQNGNAVDATIDLGRTSPSIFRFKDLYLSGGVVFGDAGGSGTPASNTLDSYEEGTWTPTVSFGGASVSVAYTANTNGRYVKVGGVVHVSGCLFLSSKGSSTGDAAIGGLPFDMLNTAEGTKASATIGQLGGVSFTAYPSMLASGTALYLYDTTTGGTLATIDDSNLTDNTSIYFAASYAAA
jgi:hypothetical protein